jgi:hypothetical protein
MPNLTAFTITSILGQDFFLGGKAVTPCVTVPLITFIRGLIMHQVICLITSSRNKMEFDLILI